MNEKNKKLIDKQIQLIDKQIKAVPRTLTNDQIQILLLEREKLVASKDAFVAEGKSAAAHSGPTIGTGLKAMGAAAAFGGDREMSAATLLMLGIAGKKVFSGIRGLFKKKNKEEQTPTEYQESEKQEGVGAGAEKPGSPVLNNKPGFLKTANDKINERAERMAAEAIIRTPIEKDSAEYEESGTPGTPVLNNKPGFLKTANDKINERAERMAAAAIIRTAIKKDSTEYEESKKREKGTPEKTYTSKEGSSDNKAIISILNKILKSFESDNERMRRSIRGAAETKLESDPTPDTPGGPVREGDDKKSGMNKLLMFGAIAGLLGLAYKFRDEIAETLKPITGMLGITNPLEDAEKEDYDFDIMDILGVSGLLGLLGLPRPGGRTGRGAGVGAGVGAGAGAAGVPEAIKNAKYTVNESGKFISKKTGKELVGSALKSSQAHFVSHGGKLPTGGPVAVAATSKGKAATKMIARGLAPVAGALAAFSLMNDLDDIEEQFERGEIDKEEYKNEYAKAVGGFLGGVAGAAVLGKVGAVLGAPVLGFGALVGGTVGGVAGFFAGEAVGKYLGEILGAKMVGDPVPKPPEPKPFTEDDQKELKKVLRDETLRSKLTPQELQILNTLANVNLTKGGLAARKAIKTGNKTFGEALTKISKSEAGAVNIDAELTGGPPESPPASATGGAPTGGAPTGGAPTGGAPTGGAPAAADRSSDAVPGNNRRAPVATPPPPSTPGTAITTATMDASEAENTVTVLPPIVNNETNNMRTGDENISKAQKVKMQVRLEDETFRSAIEATAAILNLRKAA